MNEMRESDLQCNNNNYCLPQHLIFYNDYNRSDSSLITDAYLEKWALYSSTIEKPLIVGKFNSNEHYYETLKLVLNSTLETHNRLSFYRDKIIPIVAPKGSLLDVGPGDGSITLELANYFEQITAIDPNNCALDNLRNLLPPEVSFTRINSDICCAEFFPHTYDLINFSHILYYIEPEARFDLIQNAYDALRNNGILVIALGGDELGKAKLIEDFGGQNIEIDKLAVNCFTQFGVFNTAIYASDEAFVTCTHEAMFHIASFMLGDANISANKSELNQYIESNLQLSDRRFVMTSRQKFIVIQKTTDQLRDGNAPETHFSQSYSKN